MEIFGHVVRTIDDQVVTKIEFMIASSLLIYFFDNLMKFFRWNGIIHSRPRLAYASLEVTQQRL